MEMNNIGRRAAYASETLRTLSEGQIRDALRAIATSLSEAQPMLLQANAQDMEEARKRGIEEAVLDRMELTSERLEDIVQAVEQIATLTSPIGETLQKMTHANGMTIEKRVVPLGVMAMIYEARPNVTVDAAALALKTQNAVILRGSSSVLATNRALVKAIRAALRTVGVQEDAVQLITNTSYEFADQLLTMNDYVDVIIPRGSERLIQSVVQKSTVPVIETGAGNCHVYIDEAADERMALDLALNAKLQRPSVCNAIETILIHESFDATALIDALLKRHVTIYTDDEVWDIPNARRVLAWDTEFLNESVRLKRVQHVEEAIAHIQQYGTRHSEAIVTQNEAVAHTFLQRVDASTVYHNVSTRFTDGFEFGFGAEIGISTQKLHARGPMGLDALTSTKYVVRGNGQVRE